MNTAPLQLDLESSGSEKKAKNTGNSFKNRMRMAAVKLNLE